MTSWFLTENTSGKLFQSICNYLSLGQFELARSLIRIYASEDIDTMDLEEKESDAIVTLLSKLIKIGPPDSWVCSKSVPSTAHLLCMSSDVLKDLSVELEPVLQKRIEFDLSLASVIQEVISSSDQSASTDSANEIRVRFSMKLLQDHVAESLILPRLLILAGEGTMVVLSSIQLPHNRKKDHEPQFSADLNEFLFKMNHSAPNTSPGLMELLHERETPTEFIGRENQPCYRGDCPVITKDLERKILLQKDLHPVLRGDV